MVKEIILSCGAIALIDDDYYEEAIRHPWYLHKGRYAARNKFKEGIRISTIFLHQGVCGFASNSKWVVDHINRNSLDNRKENLRVITQQQNSFNRGPNKDKGSSKYKGVFWSKEKQLWFALIKLGGSSNHLGYFRTELDAAIAYNSKAVEMFGEFAWLNKAPVEEDWWKRRYFSRDNQTGFRGVTEQKPGRWQARITVENKRLSLGYFNTPIEAAEAFNKAAIEFHGEKALLNRI